MKKQLEKIIELEDQYNVISQAKHAYSNIIDGVRIGKIASIKQTGQIFVDYRDNSFGPLRARSIIDIVSEHVNKKVLLAFEGNDPKLPIIIGLIRDNAVDNVKKIKAMKDDVEDIHVDGKKMTFSAEKEIELRCGKSSLIMKKDGRIVIKGIQLVSRASNVNKIKGAAVRIN
jgi:hypothetical protein